MRRNRLGLTLESLETLESSAYQPLDENDFEYLKELHCSVVLVKQKPSGFLMVKKLLVRDIHTTVKDQLFRDLQVLHQCVSPHIIKFHGASYNNRWSEVHVYNEYMDAGSLDDVLKKVHFIPENVLSVITSDVIEGLSYLHELGLSHRNIKPSNILVNTKGEVKLCFMVHMDYYYGEVPWEWLNKSYMCPSRLLGEVRSFKCDVWSLGLSVLELALGRYPIPDAKDASTASMCGGGGSQDTKLSLFELLDYIVDEEPPKAPAGRFSSTFDDFVEKCLRKGCSDRSDLKELESHPWIVKTQVEKESVNLADFISGTITM